ncbi:DEAD/DEAH box helicase [Cryobacterium sandaracinum]|uniref:DEAD/DEAH box helicase n=1 Tax=Cryobacterium sandaracinum TaxID=1259247 RepID=A0ABY2JCJ1_9MICO|nr:DEAD/DEAH box helicase family protein [Cryobacterium sandaracinum]TFD01402.1 DEAD/DEAH box helicase [Cryobacterium sandaracinum]
MLRDLGELQTEYTSDADDLALDFYSPCLTNASRYDRVTGFFSSTVFFLLHESLDTFVIRNDGKMRFLCSPRLTASDATSLLYGYEARTNNQLVEALRLELHEMLASPVTTDSTRLLAILIATGRLEVRLAVVTQETTTPTRRMFHDKVGLFADGSGDCVGFRGSANETFYGLSAFGNVESIDVWPSWEGGRDLSRVRNASERFERLWNGQSVGVTVRALPEEIRAELELVAEHENLGELLKKIKRSPVSEPFTLGDISLRDHQKQAITQWIQHSHRGLLAHATGSGKTITGLYACRLALGEGLTPLILVPSQLLLEQWSTLVRTLLGARVVAVGGGRNDWKADSTVRAAIENPDLERPYVIIAINNSAMTEAFRIQVNSSVDKLFVLCDEAHRIGSPGASNVLDWLDAPWRLGLSATPDRSNDPDGTERLFSYFGGIIHEFSLKDALDAHILAPYRYLPSWVTLQDHEQEQWDKLTREISRLSAMSRNTLNAEGSVSNRLRMKLIQRSRIAKSAANKVPAAVEIVQRYYDPQAKQKWLIYCDSQSQMNLVRSALYHRGISSWEYHSQMSGDPRATLDLFDLNGGIVVAIKCLDEGVDIPSATHALILASSRNPREFIQRRGRILRKSPSKTIATLLDVLVLPEHLSKSDPTWSLSIGELARAHQFAAWAVTTQALSVIEEKWVSMGLSFHELDEISGAGLEIDESEDNDK